MVQRLKFTIIASIIVCNAFNNANAQHALSGFINDAANNEMLIGAYVYDSITERVATANVNGYFSLSVETECHLVFSYVGYQKKTLPLYLLNDTLIQVHLKSGSQLGEVVVKATKAKQFNVSTLSIKEIENMPSLGGKPDVMKAMQLLPGIQSQNEASSLLVVRGGDPGQNLYLLDNTPLIYVNHLGGFMSVFNPEMVNSISVLKGGFPARYGNKLSSVVSLTQRSGNTDAHKGTFGIGVTDINASAEGPMGKKGTYIITARKTLFDLLLMAASGLSQENSNIFSYGFHDVNGKFSWRLNDKNRMWFNIYQGDDYMNSWTKKENSMNFPQAHVKNVWGNWMASGNWNYAKSAKLFGETALSYTRYRYKEKQEITGTLESNYDEVFKASVDDYSLRTKWDYHVSAKIKLNTGLQSSYLVHTPYSYSISGARNNKEQIQVNSFQNAIFLETELKPFNRLTLLAGLRAVTYNNENYFDYSFEPRLQINYKLNSKWTANASFMQVTQYAHLLFATGNIGSNEVWIPATKDISPASSNQATLGVIGNLHDNIFTVELSGYYKQMSNLATYKQGEISLKGSSDWVSKIETGGDGSSYGIEFLVKKNYGNWNGSFSYTYSKTTRNYQGLNNGKEFAFAYDRPHSLSLLLNRKLGKKWDFSLMWLCQSGLPYTPAIGRQYTLSTDEHEETEPFYYEALIYGERNSERMSAYHRLDVGFNYNKINKRGNKVVWNFSVYNLYNRQNASYYYYNAYEISDSHHPEFGDDYLPLDKYQMSFFPILPSISYKVYFDGNNPGNSLKKRLRGLLYHPE